MPTKNIPGFYGGVSTQAPTLRLDSQVEAMENCITSLLKGTEKRPPASLFKALSSTSAITGTVGTSYVTKIVKSETEGYLLIITDNAAPVNIYNLSTGVKCTVTQVPVGANNPYDYLLYSAGVAPKDKLKATTVEDYTFVTNNQKATAMAGSLTAKQGQLAIFQVKKGQVSTLYSVTITLTDSAQTNTVVSASYTSGAAEVDTQSIASNLAQAIDTAFGTLASYPEYTVQHYESYIILVPAAWTAPAGFDSTTDTVLSVTSEDGLGGTAIATLSCENLSGDSADNFVLTSQDYAQLPPKLPKGTGTSWIGGVGTPAALDFTGYTVKIKSETADSLGYYVKFTTGESAWTETTRPYLALQVSNPTLPVQIVKTAANTFQVQFMAYNAASAVYSDLVARATGDDDTNPEPSFVGRTIQDVVFYKNRLGFLAGDSLFLSKAADYFNFWATTATDVLDDDPIDLAASNTTTASIILKDAFVWNEKLLINASGRQQLTLSSGGAVLSPKSANLDIVTNFDLSTTCRPAGSGANAYYMENSVLNSNLREFYLQEDGVTKDALNLSSHVEGYLPTGMKTLESYPVKSMLLMLPTAGDAIYVYQFLQGPEGKVQSAFHKWTINNHTIYGMGLFNGSLFLLTNIGSTYWLLKIELERSTTYGDTLLDFCEFVTGVYSAVTGLTTFTPTYPISDGGIGSAATVIVSKTTGKEIQIVSYTAPLSANVSGNYSTANEYIMGKPYESSLTLSEVVHRDQQGIAVEELSVKLQRLRCSFRNTGYFKVTAVPRGGVLQRVTVSKEFWWFLVNLDTLAAVALKDSADMPYPFSCPLMMGAKGATLKIINDSHHPMEIMNIAIMYSLG